MNNNNYINVYIPFQQVQLLTVFPPWHRNSNFATYSWILKYDDKCPHQRGLKLGSGGEAGAVVGGLRSSPGPGFKVTVCRALHAPTPRLWAASAEKEGRTGAFELLGQRSHDLTLQLESKENYKGNYHLSVIYRSSHFIEAGWDTEKKTGVLEQNRPGFPQVIPAKQCGANDLT